MGVCGLIGGGIFVVLGVAAKIAGNAAFLAYLIAGGSQWRRATRMHGSQPTSMKRGSFTFIEHYTGNENVAGLVGWTLIVGYVGTMAMYAFAADLLVGTSGTWLRRALSIGIIVTFTGVNLIRVRDSGGQLPARGCVRLGDLQPVKCLGCKVRQQDAGDTVASLVDGGDEQVWLTVEFGQDDDVADARVGHVDATPRRRAAANLTERACSEMAPQRSNRFRFQSPKRHTDSPILPPLSHSPGA